jgi:hypothetical protein
MVGLILLLGAFVIIAVGGNAPAYAVLAILGFGFAFYIVCAVTVAGSRRWW